MRYNVAEDLDRLFFESYWKRFQSLRGMEPLTFEVCVDEDVAGAPCVVVTSRSGGELLMGKSDTLTVGDYISNSWDTLFPYFTAAMNEWFHHYSQVCTSDELAKDLRILHENQKRIMFDIGVLLRHTYGITSPCALSLFALGSDREAGIITSV
jgi:hypothetical protein